MESLDEKEKVLSFIYDLLKQNGQQMHYSVLLDEVAKRFYEDQEDLVEAKARFYTWINLDARFTSAGQGCWGLRTAVPQKGSRQVPLLSLMHKTVEYDDSPTPRVLALDEELLADKDLLEDEEPETEGEEQDDFDEELERPLK
ncbi:MAG: DNA-directed RNA polymerase subunit delta [Thermacetogeniaceae bacterium]